MSIRTTVRQVAMVGGDLCDQPTNCLVDERAAPLGRGRGRGNLYVLVEVSGHAAGADAMANQMLALVQDTYYGVRSSVTAGLQKAIHAANDLLLGENRKALPGERWTAGISCLVLRAHDLFVAQAGPAAVLVSQGGVSTRFPDVSPWLDNVPQEEMDAVQLGVRQNVNVDLFHTEIGGGDIALLVESALARRLSVDRWALVLGHSSVDEILDALLSAGRGDDLSAIAIKVEGGPIVPPAPQRTAEPPAPGWLTDREPPEWGAESPTSRPRTQPATQPARDVETWQGAGSESFAEPEPVGSWWDDLRLGDRLRPLGKALAALLARLWSALLALFRGMMPSQTGQARSRRAQTRVEGTGGGRMPKSGAAGSKSRDGLAQRILFWVAVAIPVVVAAVVVVLVLQRGQEERVDLETLWQNANASWQLANQAADVASVRTHLGAALGSVGELLEHQPEHAEAAALKAQIVAQLDEINRVQRATFVAKLHTYPAGARLSRVVVDGQHIFVMDRNAGAVYHHRLDSFQQALEPATEDMVLVRKGQQVGSVLVGDLVDMVWMPVGAGRQKADLVILESNGALLEYDPATRELLPRAVNGSATWQYPKLVGGYSGRFYLLDPTANRIWRYEPGQDGYSSEPYDWLQASVDLAGIVDMAIGHSIYLLFKDGGIRKLSAGEPDVFDISDWDTPPSSPTGLFTRPPDEVQFVYVADPGNSRIVQASKEGAFQRQFRLSESDWVEGVDALSEVTSLFVDEIGGRAYFLSGGSLYMIILPN